MEEREEAQRILSSSTNTADKHDFAERDAQNKQRSASMGIFGQSDCPVKTRRPDQKRKSRIDHHAQHNIDMAPPNETRIVRQKTPGYLQTNCGTSYTLPPAQFSAPFNSREPDPKASNPPMMGNLVTTSSVSTTRRHLRDRDGNTTGFKEENLTRQSFHYGKSATNHDEGNFEEGHAASGSADYRIAERKRLDRDYRKSSLVSLDIPPHFRSSKARFSPWVSLERVPMLAQDSSCAPPPQREHSPTDVHHARGQSATATEGESGCRKSTHRSASSTENRDTPPTAVARKGKANVDTGAGKAPTPRIDDTSSAPTRKANMNTDAAKAPTLRLENMPSSSSTRRGKTNENRGAAKALTHSDNTQAPQKTKRRDKSPDSGVISRPTSGLDRDQAAAGKADRGPGLMLPDIPNWIVTNGLNSTGKIATRLIWTDTRKPRTSLRKIRYAQQVTWKFANPVWSSTSRFIPRESTCGVLWSQSSTSSARLAKTVSALATRSWKKTTS